MYKPVRPTSIVGQCKHYEHYEWELVYFKRSIRLRRTLNTVNMNDSYWTDISTFFILMYVYSRGWYHVVHLTPWRCSPWTNNISHNTDKEVTYYNPFPSWLISPVYAGGNKELNLTLSQIYLQDFVFRKIFPYQGIGRDQVPDSSSSVRHHYDIYSVTLRLIFAIVQVRVTSHYNTVLYCIQYSLYSAVQVSLFVTRKAILQSVALQRDAWMV